MMLTNVSMRRRTNRVFAAIAVAACLVVPVVVQAAPTVDLNSASVTELSELPGIGPAKAAAIVEERTVAPFKSVEDLVRVRGIGDSTIVGLRDQARVSERKAE